MVSRASVAEGRGTVDCSGPGLAGLGLASCADESVKTGADGKIMRMIAQKPVD